MESSPDLQPTIEQATSAPTLLQNLNFWLLAMLLGLVLMLSYVGLTSTGRTDYQLAIIVAGLATMLSLAALPLLLPLLPWALTAPSVGMRWLRVFTLQSLSLSGLTALGYNLDSGPRGFGAAAPLVGTLYFVAGLLAAVCVYWPWLRRPR